MIRSNEETVELWIFRSIIHSHKTFDLDITSLLPIFFQFRLLSSCYLLLSCLSLWWRWTKWPWLEPIHTTANSEQWTGISVVAPAPLSSWILMELIQINVSSPSACFKTLLYIYNYDNKWDKWKQFLMPYQPFLNYLPITGLLLPMITR